MAIYTSWEMKALLLCPLQLSSYFFKYVRRAHFPHQPSRFKSFFAVETVSEAEIFNARYGEGKGTIWEVEAKVWFKGNMNLLTSNQTNLVFSYFAHCYWLGEPGPIQSFWEVLLTPPVKILKRVTPPKQNPD